MSTSHIFNQLPLEMFDIILSYLGDKIKNRNGKYMNQISKKDNRCTILDNHFLSRRILTHPKKYPETIQLFISKNRPVAVVHIFIRDKHIMYHYERRGEKTCTYFLE